MLFLEKLLGRNDSYVLAECDQEVRFVSRQDLSQLTDQEILCFGSHNLAGLDLSDFLLDLDVLYRLRTKRFDGLLSLSRSELDVGETERYIYFTNKIEAILKSYRACKIKLGKYPIESILSRSLLREYYKEKANILFLLYEKIESEKELLDFYKNRFRIVFSQLKQIDNQEIRIDSEKIKQFNNSHAEYIKRNISKDSTIKLHFNPVGAKTGRASFKHGTLQLYSLPKEMRSAIIARSGYNIVQFDYKNYQARIAIALTKDDDFRDRFLNSEDFYSEFGGDREKVKLSFLAWLFSDSYSDIFDVQAKPIREHKSLLYNRFLDEEKLVNIFGRPLYFDKKSGAHLIYQNYISSTEADMVLELSSKLIQKLKDNDDVRFLFPFHDAFIFEVKEGKERIIGKLKELIETYHKEVFGCRFPVEAKIGKNFEQLKTTEQK